MKVDALVDSEPLKLNLATYKVKSSEHASKPSITSTEQGLIIRGDSVWPDATLAPLDRCLR